MHLHGSKDSKHNNCYKEEKSKSLTKSLSLTKKKMDEKSKVFFLLGKNRNVARDACRNKRTKAPAKWEIAWAHGHIMAKSCQ